MTWSTAISNQRLGRPPRRRRLSPTNGRPSSRMVGISIFNDYTCVTHKLACHNEIRQRSPPRAYFNDYTCVTRKCACHNEIRQRSPLRAYFNDYTCVTRKSNCSKEMRFFCEVPIIPASHVSYILPTTYGRNGFFLSTQVCALAGKAAVSHSRCQAQLRISLMPDKV